MLGSRSIVGGGFRKGNGVVLSKKQDSIWITDGAGRLHLVRINKDNDHVVFQPTNLLNRMTESRSSVVLFESDTSTFAVYAVIDTPVGYSDHVER